MSERRDGHRQLVLMSLVAALDRGDPPLTWKELRARIRVPLPGRLLFLALQDLVRTRHVEELARNSDDALYRASPSGAAFIRETWERKPAPDGATAWNARHSDQHLPDEGPELRIATERYLAHSRLVKLAIFAGLLLLVLLSIFLRSS